MSSQEKVKQSSNVLVVLYIMCEHGDGIGNGKRGIAFRQAVVQDWIGGSKYGPQELELGDGRVERREHKVAYAEKAQSCDSGGSLVGTQHQQEDLNDVMVALEVAQGGVAAQDLDNDVGEVLLALIELLLPLYLDQQSSPRQPCMHWRTVFRVVDKGAIDVKADLVLVLVLRKCFPRGLALLSGPAPEQDRPWMGQPIPEDDDNPHTYRRFDANYRSEGLWNS